MKRLDDDTTYRTKVSQLYGDLVGLGEERPDNGLLDALDVPGGLADWVKAHPPEPTSEQEPTVPQP